MIEVLRRPYFSSKIPSAYLGRVRQIFAKTELVTIVERVIACRVPTDDRSLELAVNGHAELIVTGDVDLLVLNPFRGIAIITPIAFSHAYSRTD